MFVGHCAREPFLLMNSKLLFFTFKLLFFICCVPCIVVKKLKAKFPELKLLFVLDVKQKKIVTYVMKERSDFSSGLTFPGEIQQELKQ